jgi:hypothetical protein
MDFPNRWAVIEEAGYVGESVIRDNFDSWSEANAFTLKRYDADEREELHVDIAYWDGDGWSYDY